MPGEMGESCDMEEKVGESSGNNEKMSKTQSSDGYEKISDNSDNKEKMDEKRKRGRPAGKCAVRRTQAELLIPGEGMSLVDRHQTIVIPSTSAPKKSKHTKPILPRVRHPSSTSSRITYYLVGKPPLGFGFSKLPKTKEVLARHLSHMESKSISDASKETVQELKAVWLHHFGPQLIFGKMNTEQEEELEDKKIVKRDYNIVQHVTNLYKKVEVS